jgi:hypothetical protein
MLLGTLSYIKERGKTSAHFEQKFRLVTPFIQIVALGDQAKFSLEAF